VASVVALSGAGASARASPRHTQLDAFGFGRPVRDRLQRCWVGLFDLGCLFRVDLGEDLSRGRRGRSFGRGARCGRKRRYHADVAILHGIDRVDIATCTMAKVRSLGLLPTSLATRALAITFQSVTTSARADAANSAAATMPGSKAADELKPNLIGRLLYLSGSDMTARTKARRSNGSRSSLGIPGRMYWIVMMLPLISAPLARRRSSDQPDQEDRNALGPDVGRST